jgi:diacylglycerol O-acyltransferase
MRYLSGTDALMLAADNPHQQNLIGIVAVFDPSTSPGGAVTFDQVLAYVQSRLHVTDSFRERLVRVPLGLDRPAWIRDGAFDLEYHVREMALPAPGDWRQLAIQTARIGARPLDLTRPPWELYVIRRLDGIPGVRKGSFAMMLKLHHAAVDGVAGAELLTALLQATPDAQPAEEPRPWTAETPPSGLAMLLRGGLRAVTRPVAARRTILQAVGAAPRMIRAQVQPPEGRGDRPRTGATRFNAPVSAHRSWGGVTFDLEQVKDIKNAVPGSTVNDVIMALVGGALRRYLTAKDELPGGTLNAIMPISLRPTMTQRATRDDQPVTSSPGGGGNRISFGIVPLGTDVASPRERLAHIAKSTAQAKESGLDARNLMEVAELLPGSVLGTAHRTLARVLSSRGLTSGVHTIVTNVPGSRTPLYFCGAKMVSMYGFQPVLDGVGLLHGAGSYLSEVMISFTADRGQLPDPEFYASCFQDEFAEMLGSLELTSSA